MFRAKERDAYRKRRAEGKLKSISDMKKRAQDRQRKMWRRNSKNYYERKKHQDIEDTQKGESHQKGECHQKDSGRKRMKLHRARLYARCDSLRQKCMQSDALADKWKRRYYRLLRLGKGKGSPSPKKVVEAVVKSGPKTVKRRLLFSEVLQKQLRQNYELCLSQRAKQVHAKVISGSYLKKYKLGFMASRFVSSYLSKKYRTRKSALEYERKKGKNALSADDEENVRCFLEEDINSTVAPGKKDCITKNGVQKQKRYLRESLYRIHKQYRKSKHRPMSYASFCKIRPFWVVKPLLSGRDTCRCVKHANMSFMTSKLEQMKILPKTTGCRELCAQMCCHNVSSNKKCMYGECSKCKTKQLPVTLSGRGDEEIQYHQWENVTEARLDKHKNPFNVRFVSRTKITNTIEAVIGNVEKQMPAFMKHVYNVDHQYLQMCDMRDHLQHNEVLVVIDFSENYATKYDREIQSVHFGAARKQITLHTGVLYFNAGNERSDSESGKKSDIRSTSFCSVSDSLRHDPAAIWAHLMPLLQLIKERHPSVDTVNFQSDGPTTQYRNKTNFCMFVHFSDKQGWESATWNMSEAGHGKGPADGIGGLIKRTADDAVAHGRSITSPTDIIQLARDRNLNVVMFEVKTEDIEAMDKCMPKNIKPVKNTMRLHQVVWNRSAAGSLELRELTCNNCGTNQRCEHFALKPATWTVPDPLDRHQYSLTYHHHREGDTCCIALVVYCVHIPCL